MVFSRPQRGHVERQLGKRQEEKGAKIEVGYEGEMKGKEAREREDWRE